MTKKSRVLLFAAIAAAAAATWFYTAKEDTAAADARIIVTATTGTVREEVTAQGALEPKEYVDVGMQVSGQIQKLHIDIGDVVKEGDLLAEIDPRIYEARVEADTARLKTLQAQLAEQQAQTVLARQQQTRNEKLIKLNAISRDEFDTSTSNLNAALAREASLAAQIEESQSTLNGDQTNLSYTKIYAPMSGTVVSLTAKEGQTFNAVQSAPTILQIADLDTMTVRAQVAEADIGHLKEGMQASFTTLGDINRKWDSTVRQVLPTPQNVNDVILYDVLIDIDNKDRLLMNSMSTQVTFTLNEAKDVTLVPTSALTKPVGDNSYEVLVEGDNGKATPRTIATGIADRKNTEVKSGLQPGDKIVVVPAAAKKPGNRMMPPRL